MGSAGWKGQAADDSWPVLLESHQRFMQTSPKIVCLIITTGVSEASLGETIASFNKQTYQNKELVILDTHPLPMKFESSLGASAMYYPVPRSKFSTHEERFKYALFLATVRGADYVAFWSPGDIFFPWHFADLIDRIPNQQCEACTSPYPFRIGHLNGFLMKDPEGWPQSPKQIYMTHGSEAPNLSGYIFQHWTGHSVDWDAPGAPPEVVYSKLPWHTVLLGPPKVPGYIEMWNREKALFAGWWDELGSNKRTQEEIWDRAEDYFTTAGFSNPPLNISHWRYDYEALALARWGTYNGKNVDIPAGTISLWPEGWRLGGDSCTSPGLCGRLARAVDSADVANARERLADSSN